MWSVSALCPLNISYPCNVGLEGSIRPRFPLGSPFIYPAVLWAKWEPHVPCYRGSQMKCSSGGWPLTSPDAPLSRPEQCPAGLTGLFRLSTWACTLDLLHILQHVHIHTAHVDQLTHTRADHYTHSWSQQHPAELCSSLYTRSSCVQLSYMLHHCSATCAFWT